MRGVHAPLPPELGRQRRPTPSARSGGVARGFDLHDYVPCEYADPQKTVDTITVRRAFSPESAELITELAEAAQLPFPTYRILSKKGHGVSLFDDQDAKYAFVHLGKSATKMLPEVEKTLRQVPEQLYSGLGHGI